MRLVVDLQACQTDSRDRGIGRYAMSLVQAMAHGLNDGDELVIAIDMADMQRARDTRNILRRKGVSAIVVAYGYPTTRHIDDTVMAHRLAAQLRSHFFASLQPDVVLVSSFFETGSVYSTGLDWSMPRTFRTVAIGYDIIPHLFPGRYLPKGHFISEWYPARLDDFHKFDLILSISDATRADLIKTAGFDYNRIVVIGAGFDETLVCACDHASAARRLAVLGITKPFVLTVGNGDWRKNTLGALEAYAQLPKSLQDNHQLVLTQVGADVKDALRGKYAKLRNNVRAVGRVDDATLALLYNKCHVFYFPSYYEGFGLPVLEAMALGAPVLSSSAGALTEVVYGTQGLFDPNTAGEGSHLLATVLQDDQFRDRLRHGARDHALTFTWKRTAQKALGALHTLAATRAVGGSVADAPVTWPSRDDIALMADTCIEVGERGEVALERGLRVIHGAGTRRVLVDITEIVRLDAKTGVQRVTRNFFSALFAAAQRSGLFDVEPFCWTEQGIHYARSYARTRLNVVCEGADDPVQVLPSDVVFMLDSSWWSPERFDEFHAQVHMAGGEVVWMVYDLIPINVPNTCDPAMPPVFATWLSHAARTTDGFICISNATRRDLESFMDDLGNLGAQRPWTNTVYLGCDLDTSAGGTPSERVTDLREVMAGRRYCIALGTLEPRKDYGTVIDAFELLWARGSDVALVIIGKPGWNVDALVERLGVHPERGHRLFWLSDLGDQDVHDLLTGSAALVQASLAEGFGLPLIEAGALGVPLVVTDIAVFREVAGDAATFFPVHDSAALASALFAVVDGKEARRQARISPRSWHQATVELARVLGLSAGRCGSL